MPAYTYLAEPSFQPLYAQSISHAVSHSYPYLPHYPSPSEVESYSRRAQNKEQKTRLARPTNSKHDHAAIAATTSENQFLDGHATPSYNRRRMFHTHSNSYPSTTPSLAYSYTSDEDGSLSVGPETPYSVNVALWRANVHSSEDIPVYAAPYDDFGYPQTQRGDTPSEIDALRSRIEGMAYEMNQRILAFTFPETLDFEETSHGPRLAYTARNRSLLEHKEYMEHMLDQLESVLSLGSKRISDICNEVAATATCHLEQMERLEKMMWHNLYYVRWKKGSHASTNRRTAPSV